MLYPPVPQPVSVDEPIQVVQPVDTNFFKSSNYVKTETALPANASTKIADANPSRKGFIVFNNSSNSAYISFANPALAANCVRPIATFASWEWCYPICYTGPLYAIRNAGSGVMTVWELV